MYIVSLEIGIILFVQLTIGCQYYLGKNPLLQTRPNKLT